MAIKDTQIIVDNLNTKIDTKANINDLVLGAGSTSTFLSSGPINNTIPEGTNIDFLTLFPSLDDSAGFAQDGQYLKNDNSPFTTFFDPQPKIIFPDIELTTNGLFKLRSWAINIRINATFSVANTDGILAISAFDTGVLIGKIDFIKEFQTNFDLQSQSFISRLSKDNSGLVQNGLTLEIDTTQTNSDITITQLDILVRVAP